MLDGIKFLEDNTKEITSAYVVYLDLIRAKEMIVKKLAKLFVQSYGAPDIIKASSVAEEEVNFMIDVCSDHDLGSLLTVFRTLENDGIHEKFRHIPKGDACSNQKIWTTVSDEN